MQKLSHHTLRRRSPLARGATGFALLELVISTGIMAITTPLIGAGIYAIAHLATAASSTINAQADTRPPVLWLNNDIRMAVASSSTLPVDGGAATTSATFAWTNKFNGASVAHSAAYTLSSGQLIRVYDGVTTTVGRQVSAVSFSRSGSLITVTITSAAEGIKGVTDQQTVKAVMRVNG